jgi:hypothetical protein
VDQGKRGIGRSRRNRTHGASRRNEPPPHPTCGPAQLEWGPASLPAWSMPRAAIQRTFAARVSFAARWARRARAPSQPTAIAASSAEPKKERAATEVFLCLELPSWPNQLLRRSRAGTQRSRVGRGSAHRLDPSERAAGSPFFCNWASVRGRGKNGSRAFWLDVGALARRVKTVRFEISPYPRSPISQGAVAFRFYFHSKPFIPFKSKKSERSSRRLGHLVCETLFRNPEIP